MKHPYFGPPVSYMIYIVHDASNAAIRYANGEDSVVTFATGTREPWRE